jgi:RimJ/RimL family protein N-acetyltransferase
MNTRLPEQGVPPRAEGSFPGEGTPSRCWLRVPDSDDINDIVSWLATPAIHRWFDFGLGRQALPEVALRVMLQGERHRIRVFGPHGHHAASGLVAVSDVTHRFATGSFWVLRDHRRPTCADMTYQASTRILHEAFDRDRLRCITAWAVHCNLRSQRLLTRIGFRPVGLQRDCHVIDTTRLGRLLYDLLPEELALTAVTT